MLALLLYIAFGLVFGYFATLNTTNVSVHFGSYTIESIPMYLLVLLSFGIGVLFATLFYLAKLFSIQRLLNKNDKESLAYDKEIAELTKENHKLEIENIRLKTKNGETEEDDDSL